MTDNEIIKALECCSGIARCVECPYAEIEDCAKRNTIDAKELINRQKAEIERLKAESMMAEGYADALEERAKAEAIKEFAERLKANMSNIARMEFGGYTYFCIGYGLIDNLVKEMTEGK